MVLTRCSAAYHFIATCLVIPLLVPVAGSAGGTIADYSDRSAGGSGSDGAFETGLNAGCATVTVAPAVSVLPGDVLTVTVVDDSPYGPTGLNDCNDDGDRTDLGTCSTSGGACANNTACPVGEVC